MKREATIERTPDTRVGHQVNAALQHRLSDHPEFHEAEEFRDWTFQEIIISKLIHQFLQELQSHGYSEQETETIGSMLDEFDDRSILMSILALPYENRNSFFSEFSRDHLPAEKVADMLRARVEQVTTQSTNGRPILGFHTSKVRIPKKRFHDVHLREDRTRWDVTGTERSDLADVPLAYCARRYRDLYREKIGNHLYVVRDWEGYPLDRTTGWSHAAAYAIVAELDLPSVDDEVERLEPLAH
jgi:hypothetical protein